MSLLEDFYEPTGIKWEQVSGGLVDFSPGVNGGLQIERGSEYIRRRIMLAVLGTRRMMLPGFGSVYSGSGGVKQDFDGTYYIEGDGDPVDLPNWGSSLRSFLGKENTFENRNMMLLYLGESIASDPAVNAILNMSASQSPSDRTKMLLSASYTTIHDNVPVQLNVTVDPLVGSVVIT